MRINIGCGSTPTNGWVNLDNSLAVRLGRWPILSQIVSNTRIVPESSREFVRIASRERIQFANGTLRIPYTSGSIEAVYSSHMIEHLDRREAKSFLLEVRRVLRPGGVIRLAVPDLSRLVANYLTTGDADEFIAHTHMSQERPIGVFPRLKAVLIGPRNHLWMYDGRSLVELLRRVGFADSRIMPPGATNIANPGRLDLAERADESVYVEAIQPTTDLVRSGSGI